MAVMVYALVIYQLRAKAIRLRTGAPYDDRLGPVSRLWFVQTHADYSDCPLCLSTWCALPVVRAPQRKANLQPLSLPILCSRRSTSSILIMTLTHALSSRLIS
jgi:hypothetical protein